MKKNIVRIMIILTFIIIECIVLGFSNSYANTNGKALKESEKNLIK